MRPLFTWLWRYSPTRLHGLLFTLEARWNGLPFWLAHKVPNRVRYYIAIDAAGRVTTGRWGHESPHEVSVLQMIERLSR